MKPDTFVDDLKSLTYAINGLAMRVHRELGMGCLEAVYKDALEYELRLAGIEFEREKEYQIRYRDTILKHKYYADFVVQGNLHIEVKAKKGIMDEHYRQVINYLAISKCRLALLYNFGAPSLEIKRIILGPRQEPKRIGCSVEY
jgi:GxxExxY protein